MPVQAVLEFNGKDHVTKKVDDRYVQTEVELGLSNERFVQVTKGVKEGELVVMSPSLAHDRGRKEQGVRLGVQGRQSRLVQGRRPGGRQGWQPEAPAWSRRSPVRRAEVQAGGRPGRESLPARPRQRQGRFRQRQGRRRHGPPFMAKIPQEERRKLFTASEEEKTEILKKAGLTPEEMQQVQGVRRADAGRRRSAAAAPAVVVGGRRSAGGGGDGEGRISERRPEPRPGPPASRSSSWST